MSNKSFNLLNKYKSLKVTKKNFANSCYKRAPGKENSENTNNDSENNLDYLEHYSCKKNKKIYEEKKFNVGTKVYYKNGKCTKFNLFKEKELQLNQLGKNIKIIETEEDYDSDDNVIKDGLKKVEEDLSEALRIMKSKNFKELKNYSKYCKYRSEI